MVLYENVELCQRSLRKRMKANHNCRRVTIRGIAVVSKIVEKKNESKSQLITETTEEQQSCVKDR